MGASIYQASLTGGEMSPSLGGRTDLARYQTSAKTVRNWIVQKEGGITNRSGFEFINETKTSAKTSRLIPFQFSTIQTYVIEVGDQYMRFYKDGGIIESSPGVPTEIMTPYLEADIFELKFTQSADVMTICHPDYAPQQLTRSSHTSWTLSDYDNARGPFLEVNTTEAKIMTASAATGSGVTLTASGSGHAPFSASMVGELIYLEDTSPEDVKPWASGQRNNPAGSLIVGTLRRSDGKVYEARAVSGTTASDYRTGGNRPVHDTGSEWDGDGSLESSGTYYEGVRWLYRHSGFGIVRVTGYTSATVVTVTVISRLPSSVVSSGTYKHALSAWGETQGYPACVTFHQERMVFAATTEQPQAYWMTKIGDYTSFATSIPTLDDDAISKTIPGRQVNAIRHLLPLDDMMFMTSGAEFKLMTDQNGAVTPASAQAKPQTYNGCAQLPPIVIVDTALYVQEKGSIVRDLAYTYEKDKYTGSDLTTFAAHLFKGKTLVDWAFQQVPWSCVWAVRSDGVLLGLTYLREQQVAGWHRHDTDGTFESVCCISEGAEDALYAIIKRTINGSTKRYVERMKTRNFTDIRDAFFVDSGLSYDGRDQAGTVTFSGGTAWDHTETFTATLAGSTISLAAGNVGDQVVLTDPTDATIKYRLTVESVASATVCTVRPNRLLPVALRGANTAWDFGIKDLAGLDHLEAKEITLLVDGSEHARLTVASGSVTLQEPAVVIHAGLPIEADFEPLDLDVTGGETVRDKQKIVPSVRLLVEDTRGLQAGPNESNMYELKDREYENYDEPTDMLTGLAEYKIDCKWDKPGRFFVRQDKPLPATILAIIPEVTVAGA